MASNFSFLIFFYYNSDLKSYFKNKKKHKMASNYPYLKKTHTNKKSNQIDHI